LIIDVVCIVSTNAAPSTTLVAALFQDSAADALACTPSTNANAQAFFPIVFRHIMTSGTTSATTLKVRAGNSLAGTTTFNGSNGARFFGRVLASSIVIKEVLP
jgi:hypothetical protein